MFNFGGVLELSYSRLHIPRMRGFRRTKTRPAKPGGVQKGRRRDQSCARLGAGASEGCICLFRASSEQTTTRNSRAKASRGHGRGGRCVGCSSCPLLAAPAEIVSSEIVVSPALRGGNWSRRLAASPAHLLFFGKREVAVFPV